MVYPFLMQIQRISLVLPAIFVILSGAVSCSKQKAESPAPWTATPVYQDQAGPDTVLEISGLVKGGKPAFFTLEQFMALPKTEFSGSDPWIPGTTRYGGVGLYPLLRALGLEAGAGRAVLSAVNDYTVSIDLKLVQDRRYLICYEEDGKLYKEYPDERNKGPLSVAVPHEELSNIDLDVLKLDYVWWLKKIEIRE